MIKLTFSEQFKVIADKYNDKALLLVFIASELILTMNFID